MTDSEREFSTTGMRSNQSGAACGRDDEFRALILAGTLKTTPVLDSSMQMGLIVETNDPERIWNGFRLANTALDAGHTVEVFLLGDGVEAPDLDHEKFNPRGVMRKYLNEGGDLLACGTCLDSRDLEPDELRPRATMDDCLQVVEDADKVLTIG